MTSSPRHLWILLSVLVPGGLLGQAGTLVARSGAYIESYSFGSGLAFRRITEFTIPLSVTQRLGDRLVLDFATAYASATVRQAIGSGTIEHSGLVDTDLRATFAAIPGRLVFNLVGTIPTGATAVPDTSIPLFGATATDLLGFTTPSFGSGGGISGGFAYAARLSTDWAIGAGASYRQGASYSPLQGRNLTLTPGGEFRGRIGLEGPFGGGKYFRGALVYTTTAENSLSDTSHSSIGDRVLAYAAVSLPAGTSHLSVYGWDMRRLRARNWTLPLAVPRGNVLALGVRLERPLNPNTTLGPLVEFRHELTGPGPSMQLLGYLIRGGTDLRYRLSDHATGVVQAQYAFGSLRVFTSNVSVTGPRLGAVIEWSQ